MSTPPLQLRRPAPAVTVLALVGVACWSGSRPSPGGVVAAALPEPAAAGL